ncbi:MAG: T9SS type A sorting domain-containing protein [Ferruginibacter sp.]
MSPLKGANYYRASYKNAQGIFMYSKIVKLDGAAPESYSLVNNPVRGLLQVRTISATGTDLVMNIYDISGKNLLTKQVKNAGTLTNISIPTFLPGIYVLTISSADRDTESIKFIVK